MALLHRPGLLSSLSQVPTGRFNKRGVTDFINQLEVELAAIETADLPTVDVQASEDLPAYSVVTATGYNADSANTAHYGKVVGITAASVVSGNVGNLVVDGEVTNAGWAWSSGTKLFLNGTSISATPPASGFSQLVAVARNANIIIVRLEPPILL